MFKTITAPICTIALTLAFAIAPNVAPARDRGADSDVKEAKEDVEKAKGAADKTKKVKGADAEDLKGAGKKKGKEEASDAAKDAIRD